MMNPDDIRAAAPAEDLSGKLFPDAPIGSERVTLTPLKVGTSFPINMELVRSMPDDAAAFIRDEAQLRLETYVLSDKLVSDTKRVHGAIPFPASPWQHFKQRHQLSWWLRWLVRRRPVRLTFHAWEAAVTFERYATYPESRVAVPELGRPVIFERFTGPRW